METYISYLTIFIGILTLALVAQAIAIFLVYRRVNRLADELEKTVARLSQQSAKIMTQVDELIFEVKGHVERYAHAGNQISTRVLHTCNGVLDNIDRVSALAANGAKAVVHEARAAAQALLTAFTHLGRREPKQLPPPNGHSSSLH